MSARTRNRARTHRQEARPEAFIHFPLVFNVEYVMSFFSPSGYSLFLCAPLPTAFSSPNREAKNHKCRTFATCTNEPSALFSLAAVPPRVINNPRRVCVSRWSRKFHVLSVAWNRVCYEDCKAASGIKIWRAIERLVTLRSSSCLGTFSSRFGILAICSIGLTGLAFLFLNHHHSGISPITFPSGICWLVASRGYTGMVRFTSALLISAPSPAHGRSACDD